MQLITVSLELIDHHPNQPRTKLEGLKELAASISARGVIVPPIAVADGGRYVLVDGHRRVEAAKLAKVAEIPVNVAEDWTEASMLQDAMAANMLRDDMSATDTARGLQLLLTLGVDRKAVARVTGRSEAELAFAQAIAAAPVSVADKVPVQASLEEAAALVEFAGDKNLYERIESSVGRPDFRHSLERARQQRILAQTVADNIKALEKAGVPILKQNYGNGIEALSYLKIKPEDHSECPGHAATVGSWNGDIAYYCTKAKLHGASGGGGKLTDAEKAARKAKREGKALWAAATVVRREHVKALVVSKKAHVALLPFAADIAWAEGLVRGVERGYTTSWEGSRVRLTAELGATEATSPVQRLFAQAAAFAEDRIGGWVEGNGGTELRANMRPSHAEAYYAMLVETGYTLADCEAPLAKAAVPGKIAPGKPLVPAGPCAQNWDCGSCVDGVCQRKSHCNSWQPEQVAAAGPEPEAPGPAADVAPDAARGGLAAMEATLIWRHATESGCYEYVAPGTGGRVRFGLRTGEGRAVLTIFGQSREASDVDAAMLSVVAGTTFNYDETETSLVDAAAAYVAALPSGVAA